MQQVTNPCSVQCRSSMRLCIVGTAMQWTSIVGVLKSELGVLGETFEAWSAAVAVVQVSVRDDSVETVDVYTVAW